MTQKFDIIIIGGGNAGFGVSAVAAEAGKSIAFIEERDFGGTCPNRGCTPKKVLVAAGHALHEIELAETHGIKTGPAKLDWARMIERKTDMVGFIPEAMKGLAAKRGTVFKGHARFVGPNQVQVGGDVLEAENIVIATGSSPRPLGVPGAELTVTSDHILSEPVQPEAVVFIGGGVIAMEFAHVYARAGTKVTILEAAPQLLPRLDADAVAALRAETERLGVVVKTSAAVHEVRQTGNALEVVYEHGGQTLTVTADTVVNGAGRIANVRGLDLEVAGIAHDDIRIDVDAYLRSRTNPSVWVVGDALVESAQLSPIATHEGRITGHNIVHGPVKTPNYDANPTAVYTVPALASVGVTEDDAIRQGLDVEVTVNDLTGWFSAKFFAETVAWSKVLVDRKTDRILGAHMVGHHAEDLIGLFALAMQHGITATALRESPMAFPTFASDLKSMF